MPHHHTRPYHQPQAYLSHHHTYYVTSSYILCHIIILDQIINHRHTLHGRQGLVAKRHGPKPAEQPHLFMQKKNQSAWVVHRGCAWIMGLLRVCVCVCVCIHLYIHIHIYMTGSRVYICICIYKCMLRPSIAVHATLVYAQYIRMHVRIYTYACMHTYIYVKTHRFEGALRPSIAVHAT